MGYKTTLTRISSAKSTKSRQTTSYQYPSGNGVVLAGSTINSQTTAYLDITVPGQARAFTAVSGGAGTTTIISNLQYLDTNNIVTNAIAVSTTGGNILINGNGFANTSRVYVNNQLVTNTFVNSNAIIATLSANSVGNVSLAVFNSSGQSGVFSNSNVRFSGAPSWVSSGAISSYNDIASNVALEASGDGTLTYSLQSGSGSLPSGISLVSTGYLSGTATGYTTDTVVTFTLVVTDAEGQAAQQNYSYTVFIGDTYFKQTSLLLSADTANTFISDSSTNNFLITRVGDTRPNRMSPYWPGGWSAYFDGTGDYLSIANNSAFQFGTGDFTIECWINKSAAANGAIIDVRSGGTGAIPYAFYVDANNFPYFYDGSSYTSSVTIVNNAWNHIAVTRSAGTLKIFVNGVQGYTASYSTSLNATGSLLIGGTAAYTTGYISNLRLIKGTALYTANFTPSTTALTTVANTSLLTLRDSVLADNSPNNFTITRNGDTRLTTFSPFNTAPYTFTANSNSVYFDGTGDYLNVSGGSSFILDGVNFTIEAWVYVEPGQNSQALCNFAPHNTLAISLNRTGVSDTYIYIGNGSTWTGSPAIASSSNFRPNSWNHVSLVRNGSTITLYHNGVAAGTTSTMPSGMNGGLYIGSMWTGVASEFLKGYISNFRILKGTALYTANFTPSTTALTSVANTSLLTCQSTTVVDNSSNNFAITVNGNPNVSIVNPFGDNVSAISNYTWSANSYSASGYFDGTGDYLNAGSNSAFAFGTGAYTIECWIYPTTTTTQVYTGIRATGGLQLYYDPTAGFGVSSVGSPGFLFAGTLAINQWYHIAVCRTSTSSNSTFIFINGILRATGTDSTNWTVNGPLIIGANQSGTEAFTGYISNLRWVKGTALYTANFTPSTTALTSVANTSLLTCQSTTVIDNSTNNFTITVNGNPNVSIVNPFGETVSTISNYTWSANSYSASGYFDGTGDYLTVSANSAFAFGTGNFTIEFWAYIPTWTSDAQLIGCHTATVAYDWLIQQFTAGQFRYLDSSLILQSGTVPTTNQWNHYAVTRSGTTLRIFLNGIQVASGTSNANIGSTRALGIMGDSGGSATQIGYISNVRILKGTALYTGPFIPPAAPLTTVANTSILTLQTDVGSNSTQFVDQSAQNNLITRNGNASQGTYSPLVPSSWSAYFDGTGDYLSFPAGLTTAMGTGLAGKLNTMEMWVYPTSWNSANSYSHGIYGTYAAVAANGRWFLGIQGQANNAAGRLQFIYTTGTGSQVEVRSAVYNVSLNTWAHIAVTIDSTTSSSTTISFFCNGVLTDTSTGNNLSTQTTNYSALSLGSNLYINGYIGYISNFAHTYGSLKYTANFTPTTTSLTSTANVILLTLREPILADNSGNNFTITRNGDTKIVPFGPFSPQTVTPDSYSYRFSNASDYISTTNSNLALGTNDWTVESWVYPRFTANSGIFQISNVQYGLTNSNLNTVALGFSNNNKAIVRVANASYTSTGTNITANSWTHLALVKSSNVSKLYINGTLDSTIGTSGSITDTVNYTGTTNIAVGGYGSTSALANAYISNFRVVSNSAVYISNFTVNTGPISAISGTTLLTCQANTIVDGSLANLTITANANVTPSKFNPFDETVTVGQSYSGTSAGGSAYFDGTGDFLAMASSPQWALPGSYTIEFWLYPTSIPAFGGVFSTRNSVSSAYGISFSLISSDSKLWLEIANTNTTNLVLKSINTIVINQWQHIAISYNGTTLRLYLNGELQASGSVTQAPTLTDLYIGRYYTDVNNYYYLGYISNFRWLKGTALYTSNFVPPAAPALPTTANTSLLLNFTNSGVVDSTGRNVLETVNDARVTTSIFKYGISSLYFDGTGDYMYVMGTSSEMAFGSGDFTVEFWVYPAAANQTATIIDWRGANVNGAYPMLYLSSGSIKLYVNTADQISGGAVTASVWSHIALSRSSGVTKLFLNGTQTGSNYTDTNAYLVSASRPIIGSNGFDLLIPFNGYLDDIRITKGYARYTANFTAPTAPFVTK